jgi:hypothetical protein
MLHEDLWEAIAASGGSLGTAHAARRVLMRRAPKRHGRLPPARRPDLLGALHEAAELAREMRRLRRP